MLDEIKRSLNIDANDLKSDALLADFLKRIKARLLNRLGELELPIELEYIVVECVIKRYNLIGNEGMSSYSQEGESITYGDLLDEYQSDISLWINNRDKLVDERRGVLRFL